MFGRYKRTRKNRVNIATNQVAVDETIKILEFTCKIANPTGENYTTDVLRATVKYTTSLTNNGSTKSIPIIVKCTRPGGLTETFAKEINLFDKEMHMFSNILPRMNRLHGEFGIFSAHCLKHIMEPLPTLLLEDLCPLGYSVHERRYGLDLEHTLTVLQKMASFHATSVVMLEKEPNILTKIYNTGLYPDKEVCTGWIVIGFNAFKATVKQWPEYKKYEPFLKIDVSEFIKQCLSCQTIDENDFVVLNHGDLWITNMMFAYNKNGKIRDCKLIDYQLAVLGSPAIDLHYFLATSLADEIRGNIDYLLDYYYGHLLATLTKLGRSLSKTPTREEFREDFKKRVFYGLLATITVLPLVRADRRDDACLDDLLTNDKTTGFRHHVYNNEQYKSAVTHLFEYYASLGIFIL